MPYNQRIEARVTAVVSKWKKTGVKKMFGGVCHLLDGNMFCGVYKDYLILRLGEKGAKEALRSPHARPFDITGRPMNGWVMMGEKAFESDEELKTLLQEARAFVQSFPPK